MGFKLIIGGIGLLVVTGCGCVNNGEVEVGIESSTVQKDTYTLYINVTEYRPHCGGMAPTPEMEANMTQPMSGMIYYLYKGERPTNMSDFTKVVANNEGLIELEIVAGTYSMVTEDKLLSFDEFITLKKVEGIHYSNQPDSCYEEWRQHADFNVELVSDSTMYLSINHRCFTGVNPCLEYTGPYPP